MCLFLKEHHAPAVESDRSFEYRELVEGTGVARKIRACEGEALKTRPVSPSGRGVLTMRNVWDVAWQLLATTVIVQQQESAKGWAASGSGRVT
jgi:hypothetical protein